MNIRKKLWFLAGILLVGVAYIGVIMPGIPFTIPTVAAAYCFARSSEKMHNWLYGHKLFGPFLTNWEQKKVFPTKAKYIMVGFMVFFLLLMWFTTQNPKALLYSSAFMCFGAAWGWRYPGSPEEYDRRVATGEKIGWLK